MIKYRVQIDMSEFDEPAIWHDVKMPAFDTRAQALVHIEWMKKEYGNTIEYRVQPHAEYSTNLNTDVRGFA